MTMELYHKYQPVTWNMAVLDTKPEAVAEFLQANYVPERKLKAVRHCRGTIDEMLAAMEPLGSPRKYALMRTRDKRTSMFSTAFLDNIELPTWRAAQHLAVCAYIVCDIPNTISKDQRSGKYGARVLEYRTPHTPFNEEPAFGIHVVNDAGKWHFYRFGEKQPFEHEEAYRAFRKPNRFTREMLEEYC